MARGGEDVRGNGEGKEEVRGNVINWRLFVKSPFYIN
jgi:hypothetical protein